MRGSSHTGNKYSLLGCSGPTRTQSAQVGMDLFVLGVLRRRPGRQAVWISKGSAVAPFLLPKKVHIGLVSLWTFRRISW